MSLQIWLDKDVWNLTGICARVRVLVKNVGGGGFSGLEEEIGKLSEWFCGRIGLEGYCEDDVVMIDADIG